MPKHLTAGLLLALATGSALAQGRPSVSIELSTPTPRVRLDQVIALYVSLSNTEARRRVVLRGEPGFGDAGGIRIDFEDDRGTRSLLPTTPGTLTLSEAQEGNRAIVLEPGESIGMHRMLPVAAVFQKPGRYKLRAYYESPTPSTRNPNVDRNNVEGATAQPDDLTIEVTQ
jgi:hypothetical protein